MYAVAYLIYIYEVDIPIYKADFLGQKSLACGKESLISFKVIPTQEMEPLTSSLGSANCLVQVFNPSAQLHVGSSHFAKEQLHAKCHRAARGWFLEISRNLGKLLIFVNKSLHFVEQNQAENNATQREPSCFCKNLFYYSTEALKLAINKLIAHFSLFLSVPVARKSCSSNSSLKWYLLGSETLLKVMLNFILVCFEFLYSHSQRNNV